MVLIALMPVRNEDWILGLSGRAALKWCDGIIFSDHSSTDRSREIMEDISEEHPGRVHITTWPADEHWSEMAQRQSLLMAARSRGATHLAVTDADELLTGNLLSTIRPQIEQLPPGAHVDVGMPCMWRSLTQYRCDPGIWSNRMDLTLAFHDRADLCWKRHAGGDHHSRAPHGSRMAFRGYGMSGGVMHLQWASWRRLVAKHARYKCIERIKYPQKPTLAIDREYSQALNEAGLQVKDAPAEWWWPYQDLMRHVDLDRVPWFECEVRRLVAEHGAEKFKGLNLFGLDT